MLSENDVSAYIERNKEKRRADEIIKTNRQGLLDDARLRSELL